MLGPVNVDFLDKLSDKLCCELLDMPHSWEDFYYKGFEEIIRKFRHPISQETVEKSFQMLREFNPRIHYR